MSSCFDFEDAIYEYAKWHDWTIPRGTPIIATFASLTGAKIRERRANAKTFLEVMEANSPEIVGVLTPPWMWRRLTDYLYNLPEFNPFEYNYRDYDEATPGAYHGDRMTLKDLFAGDIYAEYDLGEKIDGTNVDEPTFRHRATKYLITLLSQIAQISREDAFKAAQDGDAASTQATEALQGDE